VSYPIVTDTNEVSFLIHNHTGGAIDPASGLYTFKIVSVGTLQQVTDNGNRTTKEIISTTGLSIEAVASGGKVQRIVPTTGIGDDQNFTLPNSPAGGGLALYSDIPTVDATPTDGSSNAVSSNGVFDGLANKQNTLTETNFGSFINGLTAKNTLVDADEVVSDDSADSNKAKKTTWLNVWNNYLKPKADALYQAILTDVTFGTFSTALTPKTTPVDADTVNLSDSADSNKAKKLSFANLKAWILSFVPTVITSETGIYYFNDFLGVFTTSTNDGNISSDANVGQTTTAPNSDTNKQGFANVNTTTASAAYGNIYIGHTCNS
jgi:hypothetical protein